MSTPLTDRINSLTSLANAVTGESDTTLSDAVETLVAGYGGSSPRWKTVTLTENYQVNGVANLMNFLEIPESDILNGYIFFCEFLENQDTSNYCVKIAIFKVFEGYDNEMNAVIIRRTNYSNSILSHATNVAVYATAGTVVNIYKFKGE